jgi:hypothetical protein
MYMHAVHKGVLRMWCRRAALIWLKFVMSRNFPLAGDAAAYVPAVLEVWKSRKSLVWRRFSLHDGRATPIRARAEIFELREKLVERTMPGVAMNGADSGQW